MIENLEISLHLCLFCSFNGHRCRDEIKRAENPKATLLLSVFYKELLLHLLDKPIHCSALGVVVEERYP